MSPDYYVTILASFLCDPGKLLTQNLGTLMQDFLTDDGLPMDLQDIPGIGALPTSAEQFKFYLLALLSANTATVNSVAIGAAIRKRALELAERQGAGGNPSALAQLLAALTDPIAQALASLAAEPGSVLEEVLSNIGRNLLNLQVPAAIPQGCLPSIWQQVYFSNLVNVLHTDYGNGAGDSAFVPTTTVFSFTDEIVQPQGITGFEAASGYMKNASNIFIQGNGGCPLVTSTLISGLPSVISHEGVLYSGMGIAVAVLATQSGGEGTVDMIDAAIRCKIVSPLLTIQDAVAQEATVPGAIFRTVLGGGDETLTTGFLPAEPAIKEYATVAH